MRVISRLLLMIISIITFFILLWAIANEQQKTQLNEWYKLVVNPVIRLGITVPGSLLPTIIEYTSKPQTNSPEQREPDRPIICGRVKSEEIDHRYRVYEWQDDNGQTQISDKPPTQNYSALRAQTLYVENFFDLSLDSSQAQLPAFLQNHIQAGVTKTYKTFSDVIKVAQLKKIHLNLKFISDKNQFHAYRMQVAPDSSSKATGFYTSRLNQSTIWAVGDKHHMTRITLHEATHAMVAAMFGDIPIWLNEGMAGFFEKMVITGEQTYTFATNDEHLQLLRHSRLPSLRSHFAQTHADWNHINNSDLNYAIDWSLIFYLMSRSDGRQFLRYMLDDMAVNYCQRFDALSFINNHYAGGLNQLEANWRQWLKTAPSGTVTF